MSFAIQDVATPGSSVSSQLTANQQSEAAVRRMATEFEALMLRQLTSSINPSDDDEDGESLFGNGGGGLGLSRQLFSEQMADTMAKNGGVGLADMIVKQVLDNRGEKSKASTTPPTARALDAARSIRANAPAKAAPGEAAALSAEAVPAKAPRTRIGRNPVSSELVDSNDVVIISRASDANETAKKRFITPAIARAEVSNAPAEVSANEAADSPRANSAANPNNGQRFMTEDDVMSLVRPRRVSSPASVGEVSATPIEEEGSSSLPNAEESSPVSTQPFVPTLQPVRRPVSRQVNLSPISGARHIPSFAHVVNAPSARMKAETPITAPAPMSLQMFVRGPIRSRFGPRIDPINGRLRYHTGIDIAAPAGTPIGAAAAGKVVFAGRNGGYGNMVIVEHADGTLTRYGHAQKLLVKEGDEVASGEVIALVGSTGHSTGPHLHFEVKKNGQFVNPLTILPKDFTLARR